MDQIFRKKYVLGFVFSVDKTRVALIRKNRPEWQKGLWNGIGGKIEEGELPWDAMTREFREETGATILPNTWKDFCEMFGPDFHVLCYHAYQDIELESKTDERVQWYSVEAIRRYPPPMVDNLKWLIPMALSPEYCTAVVNYYYPNGENKIGENNDASKETQGAG